MKKPFFIDLSNLRFGVFIKDEPQPNVDGRIIITYRPINSLFTKKIANIPKNALITVTRSELGGLSDADVIKVLLVGERGQSDFLDRIMANKYSVLIEEINTLKKQLEIRKGVEESMKIQSSREILPHLALLEKSYKKIQKIVGGKRKRVLSLGGE